MKAPESWFGRARRDTEGAKHDDEPMETADCPDADSADAAERRKRARGGGVLEVGGCVQGEADTGIADRSD